MPTFETLPEDVQKIIFEYGIPCKRQQNFYINKELYTTISENHKNCKKTIRFKKIRCAKCDEEKHDWLEFFGCALV